MLLLLDNYDSFTYNIYQLFSDIGAQVEVVRSDKISIDGIRAKDYRGIIISPGPGIPQDAGISEEVIRQLGGEIPILGICLGHQALSEHYGATLVQLPAPRHGHASALVVADPADSLVGAIPTGSLVGRYHSWAVNEASLPSCLVPTAYCADADEGRVLMAMRHRTEPVWSVQFHPESMISEHGRAYLSAFATAVRAWCQ